MLIPDALLHRLAAARAVAVLTGAGVSAESGVPTSRGAGGFYEGHRPEDLASPEGFRPDPVLVQRWYRHRRRLVREVAPNPAHHALVRLAALVPRFTLVTQNVDGLHERAGSPHVLRLHGALMESRCATCARSADLDAGPDDALPVRCTCGGLVRPGVVWFGEALLVDVLEAAEQAATTCDVFLSVGTSGLVYPAAALPGMARAAGAFVAEVNPEPSVLAPHLDAVLAGPAGVVLPALVAALETHRAHA